MRHLFLFIALLPLFLSGQDQFKIDSLNQVFHNAAHDTSKIKALLSWSILISGSDPATDHQLNLKIDSLCRSNLSSQTSAIERNVYLEHQGIATNNLGFIYSDLGNFEKALYYHTLSMNIKEKLGDKVGVAGGLNNIGNLYKYQGDYQLAVKYLTESLAIKEELGDKKGIGNTLNNIGTLYRNQGELDIALDFYERSLKIKREINYKKGIASSLNNIGIIHVDKGEIEKAIQFFEESLALKRESGNKKAISSGLNNIGDAYLQMGRLPEALKYCLEGLALREEIKYQKGVASSLANLSSIYTAMGAYDKAIKAGERAMIISEQIGARQEVMDVSKSLWIAYKAQGNYMKALLMHEKYRQTRDTLESEENQRELFRQEYKHKYEKQASADSIKNAEAQKVKDAELALEKAENEQQKQRSYFLYGVIVLALIFGLFIFNRFRITKKQKGIIQEQKLKVDEAFDELEEKNNEIMDSINYAQRIQSAILPSDEVFKEKFPNSFVLYKPKSIVAGDFYWMEVLSKSMEQEQDLVLIAVCDCTGHGVPGAMVSVVCNSELNRSVREFGLKEPGKILDKTRELVVKEFEKSQEDVKDGMDVAVVSIEPKQEGKRTLAPDSYSKLKYSGAHNPLWIIRKDASELEEIKANKQPIGKFDNPVSFQTHEIELHTGDTFYLFTDGYADQFGGNKGKKLKSKNFKDLLLSISYLSMEEQGKRLDEFFENWRADNEQIDDVCVIGVRV